MVNVSSNLATGTMIEQVHKRRDVSLQFQWQEFVSWDAIDNSDGVLHHGKFSELSKNLKELLDMNAEDFKPTLPYIWVAKLAPDAVVYKPYEHKFEDE